jgi:hypothetical protein
MYYSVEVVRMLNRLFRNALSIMRQMRFELCFRLKLPETQTTLVQGKAKVRLITAADSSHFLPAIELMISAGRFEPNWSVTFWDLGLTNSQSRYIHDRFPKVTVRRFPFDNYPDFFEMKRSAGSFAWKPTLIWIEALEHDELLVWMDAGDRIFGSCRKLLAITRHFGFYSPYSDGNIGKWTHPSAMSKLGVKETEYTLRNLNGALIAFDLRWESTLTLIDSWRQAALDPEVLCPKGSDLTNHRQDQALLTFFAHRQSYGVPGCLQTINKGLGVGIHHDEQISDEVLLDSERIKD